VELPPPEFEDQLGLARAGQHAEALRALEQALASDSDPGARAAAAGRALAEIARHAEAAQDWGTAERALARALELCPSYADLHFQRARLMLRLQRRHEARRSLDEAVRLNPRYRAARLERALLDANEGLIDESLAALHDLAREIPAADAPTFAQGIETLEHARWDEAESLLKRAIEHSDPDLKQQLERAHRHLEHGEATAAFHLLREIVPEHQDYPDLHFVLGLAELKLGHFDDALGSLARALELNPDFHDARVQFACALECVGETEHAARQLALVLESEPAHRRALELMAGWTERAGNEATWPRNRARLSDGGQAEEKPAA
jgi:tetratricopeptide (TPR) repeat protein